MPFTHDIPIDRAPADVFAYLVDGSLTPAWYEAVRHVEALDDGPTRVGTRWRMHRELPGGPVANVVEVAELEPTAVVTFTSVDRPTPFRYRYALTPRADGGTDLHLDGEIRGDGLRGAAAALAPLAPALFARGMRANLERLKRDLEARRTPRA